MLKLFEVKSFPKNQFIIFTEKGNNVIVHSVFTDRKKANEFFNEVKDDLSHPSIDNIPARAYAQSRA